MDNAKVLLLLQIHDLALQHGPSLKNVLDEVTKELRELNDDLAPEVVEQVAASEPEVDEEPAPKVITPKAPVKRAV